MFYLILHCRRIICVVSIFFIIPANAAIVITGTRFVYPETEREISVKLDNICEKPFWFGLMPVILMPLEKRSEHLTGSSTTYGGRKILSKS